MKQTCCSCRYMEGDYGWRPTADHHDGTCHRHAPIGIKNDKMGTPNVALWPHVKGRDTCGDFAPYLLPPNPRKTRFLEFVMHGPFPLALRMWARGKLEY